MISTHLHFDHAGGNTVRVGDEIRPSFPGAKHYVQRGEWEFAHLQNERVRASYQLRNVDPVHDAGLWTFLDGPSEVLPGIRGVPTPGHTPHHQSVVLESAGETACFLADLVPTTAHLPLPWIMGYDLEPLVTLETKRELLGTAEREEWLLLFEHDPTTPWGRLVRGEDRPTLDENA